MEENMYYAIRFGTYAFHYQRTIASLIIVIGRGWQWSVRWPTAAVGERCCRCCCCILRDGSQAGSI